MKKISNWWKNYQYKKDLLLTLAVVIAGLLVVSGGGFADYAKTKFFQIFWSALAWVGLVVFAGGWIYLKVKEKAAKKD